MAEMRCPVLVGRRDELALLNRLVAQAGRGVGGTALLVGEAGVGKSRLLLEVCAAAGSARSVVLRGRAVDGATAVPYRPLAEALQAGVRAGALRPAELTPRPLLGALAALLPAHAVVPADLPVADGLVARCEALLALLATAQAPTLLALEDLHWADADTLAVLEYLADAVADRPVLVVATLRGPEEPSPALQLAGTLSRRASAILVPVARLTPAEVLDMAAACGCNAPDPALLDRLAAHADGLPFLVEELLASGPQEVPEGFRDTVRTRLQRLEAPSRTAVEAAAVLGRQIDWSLLCAVLGLDPGQLGRSLRAATEGGLLEPDGDGLRFRHALTRDTVLALLLPPERAALARRALQALEERDPELPGPALAAAASLAAQAGLAERAVHLDVASASRARAAGALATAVTALERAQALLPNDHPARLDVDEELVHVLADAGRADRVPEVGEPLLARLALAGHHDRAAHVQLRLADVAAQAGDWSLAEAHLEQVRDREVDDAVQAQSDLVAGVVALGRRDLPGAERLATSAAAASVRHGLAQVGMQADLLLGRVVRCDDLGRADEAFARARDAAGRSGQAVARLHALNELAANAFLRLDPPSVLLEVLEQAERLGAVAIAGVAQHHLGVLHVLRGDMPAGLRWSEHAAEHARRYRLGLLEAAAVAVQASAYAAQGLGDEVEGLLALAQPVIDRDPELDGIRWGDVRAVLALTQEDRAAALRALDRAVDVTAGRGIWAGNPLYGLWYLVCAVERGQPGVDASPPEGPPVHVVVRGLQRAGDAVLAGGRGDARAAEHAAEDADALLSRSPWYRAVALRLLGEAGLRDGWGLPQEWARRVVAFADAERLPALGRGARDVLRAAGAAPARERRALADAPALAALGVTPRESDVLALLAQGATNREIASRLYLSPRTVEKHVERLLAKTGAANRAALAVRAPALRAEGT